MKNKSLTKIMACSLIVALVFVGNGPSIVYAKLGGGDLPLDPGFDANDTPPAPGGSEPVSPSTSEPAGESPAVPGSGLPSTPKEDVSDPSVDDGSPPPDGEAQPPPDDEAQLPADDTASDSSAGKKDTKSIPDSFSVNSYLKLKEQKDVVPSQDGKTDGGKGLVGVFLNAIDIFIQLIASIALIIFIIGALMTIASEGKQDLLDKGKSAMVYSIIGLVIALMSFIIVTFVQSILF